MHAILQYAAACPAVARRISSKCAAQISPVDVRIRGSTWSVKAQLHNLADNCNTLYGARCTTTPPQPALPGCHRHLVRMPPSSDILAIHGVLPSVCTHLALQIPNALYVHRHHLQRFTLMCSLQTLCLIPCNQRVSADILSNVPRPHPCSQKCSAWLYVARACRTWLNFLHTVQLSQNKSPGLY